MRLITKNIRHKPRIPDNSASMFKEDVDIVPTILSDRICYVPGLSFDTLASSSQINSSVEDFLLILRTAMV